MNYIWPAINTCLIVLLAMYIGISNDINTAAIDKVKEFEIRLDERKVNSTDTIVFTINNNINLEKIKK